MPEGFSRFLKYCLASGLPFGFITAMIFGDQYGGTLLQSVVFGSAVAVAFGISQGVVSRFFRAVATPSCLTYLLRCGVMGKAGLVGGIFVFGATSYFPAGNWHQLPTPPEKPAEIISNSPFNIWGGMIFVKVASGRLYSYNCYAEQVCSWTELDSLPQPPAEQHVLCEQASGQGFPLPNPPGKATQFYRVKVCGVDYDIYVAYVLLADGSIWTSSRFWSMYQLFGTLPLFASLGLLVAVIVAGLTLSSSASASQPAKDTA